MRSLQLFDDCFFDRPLAGGHARELRFATAATDRESGICRQKFFPGERARLLKELIEIGSFKPTNPQEYPPGGPQPEVGPTDRRSLAVKEDLARIEDAVFVAERSKLAGEDCFETHRGGRD